MAKYDAEFKCAKCGKGFTPEKGKPMLYCSGCIEKMAKPNHVADAYRRSTAGANKNAREGIPWGTRGLNEEERGT